MTGRRQFLVRALSAGALLGGACRRDPATPPAGPSEPAGQAPRIDPAATPPSGLRKPELLPGTRWVIEVVSVDKSPRINFGVESRSARGVFVRATITMYNSASTALALDGKRFRVLDEQDHVYPLTYALRAVDERIFPGEKRTGGLVFDVPETTGMLTLIWDDGFRLTLGDVRGIESVFMSAVPER
jgi:hypothetical protein